jgi:hypothetical protein
VGSWPARFARRILFVLALAGALAVLGAAARLLVAVEGSPGMPPGPPLSREVARVFLPAPSKARAPARPRAERPPPSRAGAHAQLVSRPVRLSAAADRGAPEAEPAKPRKRSGHAHAREDEPKQKAAKPERKAKGHGREKAKPVKAEREKPHKLAARAEPKAKKDHGQAKAKAAKGAKAQRASAARPAKKNKAQKHAARAERKASRSPARG